MQEPIEKFIIDGRHRNSLSANERLSSPFLWPCSGPLYALTRRLNLGGLRQSPGDINRLLNHVILPG